MERESQLSHMVVERFSTGVGVARAVIAKAAEMRVVENFMAKINVVRMMYRNEGLNESNGTMAEERKTC